MSYTAVVEVPAGTRNNYELDSSDNTLFLKRVVPIPFPANYGYITGTTADDAGETLDVFIITDEPLETLCKVEIRPIGYLKMVDDGIIDDKVIAVATRDKSKASIKKLSDLGKNITDEIQNFMIEIKKYQGVSLELDGWRDEKEALALIESSKV